MATTTKEKSGTSVIMGAEGGKGPNNILNSIELLQKRYDYWDYIKNLL